MSIIYSKYRIEFVIGGRRKGAYLGDTVKELHEAIDNDKRLDDDKGFRNILKYGYFGEFSNQPYKTQDYVIDNCIHFMWNVKGEE